jgi:hypothetical protein
LPVFEDPSPIPDSVEAQMNSEQVRGIKSRIIAAIAKELDGTVDASGEFSKHSKSPDYSLYGRRSFIRDAPKDAVPDPE